MLKKLLALMLGMALMGATSAALAADKVVYHVNDSASQALSALRNMRNQLDTAPDTSIKLVAHADGVDFLMTDYKDAAQVGPLISALAARGVAFEVCEITLKNRKLAKDAFVMEADFTPSGVVRITRLQQEGYAYIKP